MAGDIPSKRRGGHYPIRRSIVLTVETAEAIDRASDRYGIAAGTITREAIERGIGLVLESYRKQARNIGRKEGRK